MAGKGRGRGQCRHRLAGWEWLLHFAALAGLVLAAASSSPLAVAERIVVALPSPSLSYFPVIVAERKGMFRDEGLEAKFVVMKAGIATKALAIGDVHYTTAFGSTISAAIGGLPLKNVMAIADRPIHMVMAKPGIQSIRDLKGKVVGVESHGSTTDVEMRLVLKKSGLDPNRDLTIIAIGDSGIRLSALKAGSIDGTVLAVPFNVLAKKAGFTELLYLPDLISFPLAGIGTSHRILKENPQQVKRVLRAALRGIHYTKANPEEAVRIMSDWLQMDKDSAEYSYGLAVKAWGDDGVPEAEGMAISIQLARERLGVKREVREAEVADWTLVKEVYRELKERR